jgi:general secretion pathway protein G
MGDCSRIAETARSMSRWPGKFRRPSQEIPAETREHRVSRVETVAPVSVCSGTVCAETPVNGSYPEPESGECAKSKQSLLKKRGDARRPSGDREQRGFTLVELLIVCAVIMTIMAIAIPSLMASMDQARVARAVGDISAIETGVATYEATNGVLPDDLAQAGYAGLLDPWGTPYQYLNHDTLKGNGQARKDRFLVPLNDDYDLYSMGKDRGSVAPITAKVSQDDIIRADSAALSEGHRIFKAAA